MDITTALLCDAVTIREGLLHVLGGGITRVFRSPLPAALGVQLALVLDIEPQDLTDPHEVSIDISDPGGFIGRVMAGFQAQVPPRLEPGENVQVPLPVNLLPLAIRAYGKHTIEISVDGRSTRVIRLWVLHPEEQLLPPLT